MAYGMNQLRKAGRALSNFDDKYADAAWNEDVPELFQVGHVVSLGMPGPTGHNVGDAAIKAANFASRYALPAGGVTLAGKGLYDLTGMFIQENEQTSGTLMP